METQHWLSLMGTVMFILVTAVGYLVRAVLGIRAEAKKDMAEFKAEAEKRFTSQYRAIAYLRDKKVDREYVDLVMQPVKDQLANISENMLYIRKMLEKQNGKQDD